jgi:hypothetical protein
MATINHPNDGMDSWTENIGIENDGPMLGSCRIHGTNRNKMCMAWEKDSERRRFPCKMPVFRLIQLPDAAYDGILQMASSLY